MKLLNAMCWITLFVLFYRMFKWFLYGLVLVVFSMVLVLGGGGIKFDQLPLVLFHISGNSYLFPTYLACAFDQRRGTAW